MRHCDIDTFRVCIGCINTLPAECVGELGIEVFFSSANGNPTCTNQSGSLGSDRTMFTPRPPKCPSPENCDTNCPLYLSNCNSYSITYGCDYADVEITNDHGYPTCGPISEFEINFASAGLGLCSKEADSPGKLPQFRNWKVVQDPTTGKLIYTAPPGCGLATCDKFKVRIPFCCESKDHVMILLGEGLCGGYSQVIIDTIVDGSVPGGFRYDTTIVNYPGSGGTGGIGTWTPITPPGCATCFYDKDKGVIREGMKPVPGVPGTFMEDPSGCDTLILYNRNHASGTMCGNDPTGNKCWKSVDIEFDPAGGTPCDLTPPAGTPPPILIGPNKWRITLATPICGCDEFKVWFCCFNGKITWTTYDQNGVSIATDSVRGDYGDDCSTYNPSPPTPKTSIRTRTPDLSNGSEHTLGAPAPNPTNGKVSIPLHLGSIANGTGRAIVNIHDVAGNIVLQMERNVNGGQQTELNFDGSGWKAGTYFVSVEIGGSVLSTQFVLRK